MGSNVKEINALCRAFDLGKIEGVTECINLTERLLKHTHNSTEEILKELREYEKKIKVSIPKMD